MPKEYCPKEKRRNLFQKGHPDFVSREIRISNGIKISKSKMGHVVSEDTKKKIAKAQMGKQYHLGYKHSEETKEQIRKKRREQKNINTYGLLSYHFTEDDEKKRIAALPRGKNSYLWKGGITPINKAIRNSLKFKLWRESVFKRDNWTCVWCGQWGGILHADHIKMFALYLKLRFFILNGQTLCKNCHTWKTKWDIKIYMGKVPELNIV